MNFIKEHKKNFFFSLVLLTLFLSIISFALEMKRNIQLPTKPEQIITTPTPILTNIKIISVSPSDKAINIPINQQLVVVFSQPLSVNERQSISLTFTPKTAGSFSWSSDGLRLLFTPKTSFLVNQEYAVIFSFLNQKRSWVFTTVSVDALSNEEKNDYQTKQDISFSQEWNELYSSYPWFDKFPLIGEGFFVYINTPTKEIVAKLYPKSSSSISQEQQIITFKNTINQQIKSFGVNLEKITVVWKITPQP